MGLEDFERELTQSRSERSHRKRSRSRSRERDKEHRKHHRRHDHQSSHRSDDRMKGKHRSHLSHKSSGTEDRHNEESEDDWVEKQPDQKSSTGKETNKKLEVEDHTMERDAWMVAPLEVEHVRSRREKTPPPKHVQATGTDVTLKIHDNELNHHLRDEGDEDLKQEVAGVSPQHDVEYTFGDSGSSWRMMKLKNVYRQAEESGRKVEDVAIQRYGELRLFDDAREEEIEVDRRKNYGSGYVGKEKPSGELFQERKLNLGVKKEDNPAEEDSEDEFDTLQGELVEEKDSPATTMPLDQTALNKLKAEMMKAKIKGGPEAAKLEAQYNEAVAAAANRKQPDVVVLNKMENRMLAGGRKGEVNTINNKRGRERGLVQENEDMTIEDMVRQERRTKGQFTDSGKDFADRIAKDTKFDNDLDYMDENAAKLAKAAPKSSVNLRNTAISDYQKMKHILDTCPLCHHEDTDKPPLAPLVSLATRTYLTLPTDPEITPHSLCATVVPIQHRLNLLECDEDEWEEIRNFMKSLARFYYAQKPSYTVIFYENAAHEGRKRHASLEAVPLPAHLGEQAPAFFREAILAADEEWTQHKKVIDTGKKAADGMGKLAFRRSMVSELPYFHVWFTLDGGLGHVVEDTRRWPKGDLFAREIIGGMLDVDPTTIRRQGRWKKGDVDMESRVRTFRKGWEKWDWTKALMDAE